MENNQTGYQLLSIGSALCFTLGAAAADFFGGVWGCVILAVTLAAGFYGHRIIYQLGRLHEALDIKDELEAIQKKEEEHGEQ